MARCSVWCLVFCYVGFFFFSSRRRHTRLQGDWSSDVCSSDLFSYAPHLFFFVSDAVQEIEAARSVGMQAILCERDSRASSSPTAGGVIRSFDGVLPDQRPGPR